MFRLLFAYAFTSFLLFTGVSQAQTLAAIRAAHHLNCGTVQGADDWNGADIHGNLSAFEADICRAVAVAIFGTEDGLTILVFPAEPEALAALKTGAIHLAIGISPSTSTAVRYGVGFGTPVFYDSQRILVAKQSGIVGLSGLRDQLSVPWT
jgi:general L-amino acid transport system substrate-binding protein